jgi:hypothetical protein
MAEKRHGQGGAGMRDPLEHVQELAAKTGPRGATTEGERRGAEYARRQMERRAHSVTVEPFSSCPTLSWPWGLVAVLLVVAAVLVWLYRWAAVVAAAAGFAAFVGLAPGSFEVGRLLFCDYIPGAIDRRHARPRGAAAEGTLHGAPTGPGPTRHFDVLEE